MIELTEQQRQAISLSDEAPPIIMDPETKAAYVLIHREVYQRLRNLLEEDDARLMEPLLAEMDAEDWEDASAYEGKP